MGNSASNVALAVCLSLLVGAFGVALGRRCCDCEQVVLADVRSGSSLGFASAEPLPAASTLSSDDVLVREAASTPDVDAKLTSMVAELEAEVARLRSELGTTRLASLLVGSAPADEPLTLGRAMRLLEMSYLTEQQELRAMFLQEVRQDAALDLILAEPAFRTALAGARHASPYEWPARRDQLVQDFVLRLVDAGLTGRTIEHYRATLADYLSP